MPLCRVPAMLCRLRIQMLFKEQSLEGAQALKSKEGNNSKQGCLCAALFLYHPLKVYTEVLFASQATSD